MKEAEQKIKILIINTNCSWNKGSEAQVVSTIETIRKQIPNTEFTLISYIKELDFEENSKYKYPIKVAGRSIGIKNRKIMYLYFTLFLFISLSKVILYRILGKIGIKSNIILEKDIYLNEYNNIDFIIDLSGDSFSDSRGGISLMNAFAILIGILMKKPIVFFSQSIGPFKKITLPLAKYCLEKSNLIFIREEISKKYLCEIGVSTPIYLFHDCAFLLDIPKAEKINKLLIDEGVKTQKNNLIVGLNVSELIYRTLGIKYINIIIKLINYLVINLNSTVILIPHTCSPKIWGNDDRVVAQKIYELLDTDVKKSVCIIKGNYSPKELKGVISRTDIVIASRMHAAIGALSCNIPTIVIGWSHKYDGIMNLLGLEDYVCRVEDLSSYGLISKVDGLVLKHDEIEKKIHNEMPGVKNSTMEGFRHLCDLITLKTVDMIFPGEMYSRRPR